MINWYRAIRFQPQPVKTLNNVSTPALLIWGKKDIALEYKMAQLSIDKCSNGKLVYFPDATHWVHHEKKTEVQKLIFEFIKSSS